MKRRHEHPEPSEQDERDAVAALKQQIAQLNDSPVVLTKTYWANLLVRTNQRVDDASGAKAISISWAARVAIPGVVAILFFFIGLHYYVPDLPKRETSVASMVNTLPQDALDSILVHPEQIGASLSSIGMSSDIFQFSSEQLTDYLAVTGSREALVETLDDSEVARLLVALDSKKNL
jgi:hypothetical protein